VDARPEINQVEMRAMMAGAKRGRSDFLRRQLSDATSACIYCSWPATYGFAVLDETPHGAQTVRSG